MKCPKCGYLGFETSDRCRNCGYDFSLSTAADLAAELPLHSLEGPGAALADLELGVARVTTEDRLSLEMDHALEEPIVTATPPDLPTSVRTRTPPASGPLDTEALPLFPSQAADDGPAMTPPPARPPLSVRRTTPEIPRGRTRSAQRRAIETDDLWTAETPAPGPEQFARATESVEPSGAQSRTAGRAARMFATIVDLLLLALTDAAIVYLTLALTGLPAESVARLPWLPLAAFLLILNGGYLITFIAASGQTIGKMLTGIRVIGDDGRRVDISGAVLRAAGCLLSILSAGLGYLPAFLTADRRALQDRLSGTRVVSAR